MELRVEHDYQGQPLPGAHHAWLRLARAADRISLEFDAPFFDDPAPAAPPGPTDRLWEHEVIELFIAGDGVHYFELELGPHGHHLALELDGVRTVRRHGLPIAYDVAIARVAPEIARAAPPAQRAAAPSGAHAGPIGRYRGAASWPSTYLPEQPTRLNAYLIHGSGAERCHAAWAKVPGARPDFHRLECFGRLSL